MLELVLLSSLFLVARSTAGAVPPPQNLSMVWVNVFQPKFSWEPPQPSMTNCQYEGTTRTQEENGEVYFTLNSRDTSYSEYQIMEGGFLHFSLKTVCDQNESEPAVFEVHYPELVTSWTCHRTAVKQAYCSWSPARDATDLQFFYRFSEPSTETQCSLYKSLGDGKTGCDLQPTDSVIYIGFIATVNNTLVRNTFEKDLLYDVRPPPLTWNITKTTNTFHISWVPPEMLDLSAWRFQINFTECAEHKRLQFTEVTQYQLARIPRCQYCVQIKAVNVLGGQTPLSDERCFDADDVIVGPLVFAAIFIPLVIAFLVAGTCCCWAFRNSIFPKVPKPRDLLSDHSSSTVNFLHKLYTPAEEEENCFVTLVEDTPTKKPNC